MAQLTVRPVQGTVQDGTLITIQASTPGSANGFSINLACGPGDLGTSDIALHINPRFSENSMPRNSFQNGSWGAEDRSGAGLPIQKGQSFECILLVQNDKFMISFNGQHFGEFKHRIPKERITHVVIKGDVQVNNVMFTGPGAAMGASTAGGYGGGAYGQPAGGYGQPQPAGGYGQPGGAQSRPIPGGLTPGRIIYINGKVNPNAQKFTVNLKYQEQSPDIVLHLNVRFNEHATVKNSLLNGSWGAEERAAGQFPFQAGAPLAMMILADPQGFKVAVNGAHYTEFPFRGTSLQAVQCVQVDGDLTELNVNAP
jgi:hypothetical protein